MAKKRSSPKVTLNQEALKYCFKEGYKVYPITTNGVTFKVEMTLAHQKHTLPEEYKEAKIHQAIADTLEQIYNKRKQ